LQGAYEHLRDAHLRDWMLYVVDHLEVQTAGDLVDHAHRAFDFRNNPWMKLVGLDRQFANDSVIEQNLNELISRGWLVDQAPLIISSEGKEHLKRQTRPHWKAQVFALSAAAKLL
jgi:hypothetical protein